MRGFLRTLRYARAWTATPAVTAEETEILRDGKTVPATLVLPARGPGPLGAWIALGGVSRRGRAHPQMRRFSSALAATGAAVLVPEVPEWQNLDVTPRPALPTIRASLELLERRSEVRPGRVGLVGFSFGAPQVAIAATRDDVAERVAGLALFGSYCSLERIIVYLLTGGHEWGGTDYASSPDPYGRWVLAGCYLTEAPGYQSAGDVAAALRELAADVSERGVSGWDARNDARIAELRATLPAGSRELYDLFARPSGATPAAREEALAIARRLYETCLRVEPLLEPGPHLAGLRVATHLIHGRGDRLIPYTESMRLEGQLPEPARRGLTVTGLFGHTAGHAPESLVERVREGATFFQALRAVVNTV
jgi:pimeloyl-ACP methyl ester carboxylesterase